MATLTNLPIEYSVIVDDDTTNEIYTADITIGYNRADTTFREVRTIKKVWKNEIESDYPAPVWANMTDAQKNPYDNLKTDLQTQTIEEIVEPLIKTYMEIV